jgi:hypothetical protein
MMICFEYYFDKWASHRTLGKEVKGFNYNIMWLIFIQKTCAQVFSISLGMLHPCGIDIPHSQTNDAVAVICKLSRSLKYMLAYRYSPQYFRGFYILCTRYYIYIEYYKKKARKLLDIILSKRSQPNTKSAININMQNKIFSKVF